MAGNLAAGRKMRKKSRKPGKQRKACFARKLHKMGKEMSCHLSKELRKATGRRALGIRKGDMVVVMRGKRRKSGGKVARVNRQKGQVFIEKMTRKKADGTEMLVPIRASNLMIVELEKSDEKRLKGKKGSEKTKTAENKGTGVKPKNR